MKCCDLTAGKLRHKVRVMQESRTPDGQGGYVKVWEEFKSLQSFIKPVAGYESFLFDKTSGKITHKIYARFTSGLNASMRIYYRDRVFRVVAILNVEERDRWIEIQAEEFDSDRQ